MWNRKKNILINVVKFNWFSRYFSNIHIFKCTDVWIHYVDKTFKSLPELNKFISLSYRCLALCGQSTYLTVCLMISWKKTFSGFFFFFSSPKKMMLSVLDNITCPKWFSYLFFIWKKWEAEAKQHTIPGYLSIYVDVRRSWHDLILRLWNILLLNRHFKHSFLSLCWTLCRLHHLLIPNFN